MNCPNCGNLIPENAESCPLCGASAKPPRENIFLPYSPEEEIYTPAADPARDAEPTAEATAEPAPEAPPLPPKRKLRLLLLCIPVLIAVAAILLFSVKTVYLLTETVSDTEITVSKVFYEYDKAGRITKYTSELYCDSGYTFDSVPVQNADTGTEEELPLMSSYSFSYDYDKRGKIVSVVIDNGYNAAKVEYVYENGVITGFDIYGFSTYSKPVIEYNDRGLLTGIGFPYYYVTDEAEYFYSWEFEYYDSGRIACSSLITAAGTNTVTRYDEAGNIVRTEIDNGATTTTYVFEYDARGNMTLREGYTNGELNSSQAIEYTYSGDRLESLVLTAKSLFSQDDIRQGSYTFTCQYNGNEGTLTVAEKSGDESVASLVYGTEPTIRFRVDDAGNLVYYEIVSDGELQTAVTNTYEKFRVSRDYTAPNVTGDPLYLYFLQNLT